MSEIKYCLHVGCVEIMDHHGQLRCSAHAMQFRRDKARAKKHNLRKTDVVIGEHFLCGSCGAEVVRNNWQQLYCKPCSKIVNKQSKKKSEPDGCTINLGYGESFASNKRIMERQELIVRASRLPGYNKHYPEKFISLLEGIK